MRERQRLEQSVSALRALDSELADALGLLEMAEAEGEAARFVSVYEQYAKAPEVTRKRLYLETMETVIGNSNRVIIDPGASGTSGVLPYLPLPAVQGAAAPAAATTAIVAEINLAI